MNGEDFSSQFRGMESREGVCTSAPFFPTAERIRSMIIPCEWPRREQGRQGLLAARVKDTLEARDTVDGVGLAQLSSQTLEACVSALREASRAATGDSLARSLSLPMAGWLLQRPTPPLSLSGFVYYQSHSVGRPL